MIKQDWAAAVEIGMLVLSRSKYIAWQGGAYA
jgi:hypothetical protein